MATREVIRDYIISIGVDSKEADKAIKALETRLRKISGKTDKLDARDERRRVEAQKHRNRLELEGVRSANRLAVEGDKFRNKLAVDNNKARIKDEVSAERLKREATRRTAAEKVKAEKDLERFKTGRRKLERRLEGGQGKLRSGILGTSKNLVNPKEVSRIERKLASIRKGVGSAKTTADLNRIAGSYATLEGRIQRASRAQRGYNTAVRSGFSANRSMRGSLDNMARSYLSVFAAVAGLVSVNRTMQEFESLSAVMLNASDGAEDAASNMQFASNEANRLGVDLATSIKGFAQFGTAAKSAGFGAEETRSLFTGINEVITANGLSIDDAGGVMRAFVQIMSKGNVQAEELRGQLGDRLPRAFTEAAAAMGVTTDELNKQLKAGQVNSKDFVEKFIPHMQQLVHDNGSLAAGMKTSRAGMTRFTNAFKENVRVMGEAGLAEGLAEMWKGLGAALEAIQPLFVFVGNSIGHIAKKVGLLLQTLRPVLNLLSQFAGLFGFAADSVSRIPGAPGLIAQALGGQGSPLSSDLSGIADLQLNSLKKSTFGIQPAAPIVSGGTSVDKSVNISFGDVSGSGADDIKEAIAEQVPLMISASVRGDN